MNSKRRFYASLHTDSISFVQKGTVETVGEKEKGGKKKKRKKTEWNRTKCDDQILSMTFREESPSLRQLLRRWKSEEIEERKWKAKWLESGLISMQNARLVLRVHAWSLVPPPPSFISNRQPCWIRAPNPFRILPSPSPSSLSLPYVSRLFYALVAR